MREISVSILNLRQTSLRRGKRRLASVALGTARILSTVANRPPALIGWVSRDKRRSRGWQLTNPYGPLWTLAVMTLTSTERPSLTSKGSPKR